MRATAQAVWVGASKMRQRGSVMSVLLSVNVLTLHIVLAARLLRSETWPTTTNASNAHNSATVLMRSIVPLALPMLGGCRTIIVMSVHPHVIATTNSTVPRVPWVLPLTSRPMCVHRSVETIWFWMFHVTWEWGSLWMDVRMTARWKMDSSAIHRRLPRASAPTQEKWNSKC